MEFEAPHLRSKQSTDKRGVTREKSTTTNKLERMDGYLARAPRRRHSPPACRSCPSLPPPPPPPPPCGSAAAGVRPLLVPGVAQPLILGRSLHPIHLFRPSTPMIRDETRRDRRRLELPAGRFLLWWTGQGHKGARSSRARAKLCDPPFLWDAPRNGRANRAG